MGMELPSKFQIKMITQMGIKNPTRLTTRTETNLIQSDDLHQKFNQNNEFNQALLVEHERPYEAT